MGNARHHQSADGAPPLRPVHGYQHHHVIPLALARRSQIGQFLDSLKPQGFHVDDRARNCLWLPAKEALAWHSGAALHRGPHPHYTDVVAARIDRIRSRTNRQSQQLAADYAIRRLARLQRALTHVLAGPGPRLVQLNRRDPLRLFADYSYLDAAIAELDLSAWQPPTLIAAPINGDG